MTALILIAAAGTAGVTACSSPSNPTDVEDGGAHEDANVLDGGAGGGGPDGAFSDADAAVTDASDASDGRSDVATNDAGVCAYSLPFAGFPLTPNAYNQVEFADLNRDGNADIIATEPGFLDLRIRFGDGSGHFLRASDAQAGSPADAGLGTLTRFAVGDVDGANGPDLVIVGTNASAQAVLRVLLNDGLGAFQKLPDASTCTPGSQAVVADVDGDGHLDLVGADSTVARINVCRGDGTGTFASATLHPVAEQTRTFAVGDLDGDNKLDLASVAWNATVVTILKNASSPATVAFTVSQVALPAESCVNFPNCPFYPYRTEIVDINKDSKPDVAFSMYGAWNTHDGLVVLKGDGNLGFTFDKLAGEPQNTSHDTTQPNALLDVDGDGMVEFVTKRSEYDTTNSINHPLRVRPYSAAAYDAFTASAWPVALAKADIDGDGRRDLILDSRYALGIAKVRGTKFDEPKRLDVEPLASGDLDGDGLADFVARESNASLSLRLTTLGTAPSLFGTKALAGATSCSGNAVVADFTGDSKLDIAACGKVFVGDGVGNFSSGAASISGLVIAGDVNGDGVLDLVSEAPGGRQFTFAMNNGQNPLAFAVQALEDNTLAVRSTNAPYDGFDAAISSALADFDKDGKLDLAAAEFSEVGVMHNTGTGTSPSFAAAQKFAIAAGTTNGAGVVAYDVDRDGRTDIVVVNTLGIHVLRNSSTGTGNISFAAPSLTPFHEVQRFASARVVATDLDADGWTDVVVHRNAHAFPVDNPEEDHLVIARGGAAGFALQWLDPVVAKPAYGASAFAVADVTADGRPDVIVGKSVLENGTAVCAP